MNSKSNNLSPSPELHQAIALHKSGKLNEAKTLYKKLLNKFPQNVTALTNLGAIEFQQGKFNKAIKIIEQSLKIKPDQPFAHNNLGNALKELKRFDDALTSYNHAIELKPDYADAYFNRATILKELYRLDDALTSFDRAIELRPDYADAYNNRGITLIELKRLDDALVNFDRAIELKPSYADTYNNRGIALQKLKRLDEALKNFDRAVELKPDYIDAYNNRGFTLKELKRPDEELANYDREILLKPNHANIHFKRASVLKELKRFDEALVSYDRAIELEPNFTSAHFNRGNTLNELRRHDEALSSFERTLALKPDYADALLNLGNTFSELNRYDEALSTFERTLAIKPEFAEAYLNKGNALNKLKRLDEALVSYNRAIELRPDYADAHWNKALLKLLLGEYREGWQLYEWRRRKDDTKNNYNNYSQPLWLGDQPLQGKTILIYSEQGFGDTIHFCRYVPMVEKLGANVILATHNALSSLIGTLKGNFTIVENGKTISSPDFQCPMMSLPLAFKTSVETIPASIPYLFADPLKKKLWNNKLGKKTKTRIGLAWSGNAIYKNDRNRSLSLKHLSPILKLPFEFHSIQKEYRATDLETLNELNKIQHHQNELEDFSDTAALIDKMDLVISVDTSVAHLAGALGKKVLILLPYVPDFRWMLDRSDSPWYPTATLFRQPETDDWESAIADIIQYLKQLDKH